MPVEVEKIVYQSCEDDPMGNRTKNWGRSGHSHCHQPYSWTELIKGYKDSVVPYKVGGLGKLLEPHAYETWVCLEDAPCGDPQYCWVYHETNKVFTPWGTNGELRLVTSSYDSDSMKKKISTYAKVRAGTSPHLSDGSVSIASSNLVKTVREKLQETKKLFQEGLIYEAFCKEEQKSILAENRK